MAIPRRKPVPRAESNRSGSRTRADPWDRARVRLLFRISDLYLVMAMLPLFQRAARPPERWDQKEYRAPAADLPRSGRAGELPKTRRVLAVGASGSDREPPHRRNPKRASQFDEALVSEAAQYDRSWRSCASLRPRESRRRGRSESRRPACFRFGRDAPSCGSAIPWRAARRMTASARLGRPRRRRGRRRASSPCRRRDWRSSHCSLGGRRPSDCQSR